MPSLDIADNCICCGSTRLSIAPAILMPFVAFRIFGWRPQKITKSWNLRDIENGKIYSICNSLFFLKCNLLFLDIRFNNAQLSKLYNDYRGPDYVLQRSFYETGYRLTNEKISKKNNYVDHIEEFILPYLQFPIRVLDWGGGNGVNTPFISEYAEVYLHDISGAKVNKKLNINPFDPSAKIKYNLITCQNVLEHIPYPIETLVEIKKYMHKNTLLYVEVPYEKLMRKININMASRKKYWHEHINFFSFQSIRALMKRAGLEIVDFRILINNEFPSVFQFLIIK